MSPEVEKEIRATKAVRVVLSETSFRAERPGGKG